MYPIAQCLVLCLMSGFPTEAGPGGDDLSAYLTGGAGPKRLKEPLTLREEQSGFAGKTGKIRTIEPDGKWRLEAFRTVKGKEEITSTKTGQLDPANLDALAKDLAAHDLMSLPEKLGGDEPVNAHKVILQFGTRRATLSGVMPRLQGDESTKALIMRSASNRGVAGDKIWARYADLAHAIESRVAPPKD
jgi:hypothetical protein